MTPLVKFFDLRLRPGSQTSAEDVISQFTPAGPEQEPGTLIFQVYRDPEQSDRLVFVEHFTDQDAYDAHTSSTTYKEYIEERLQPLADTVEIHDYQLVASTG